VTESSFESSVSFVCVFVCERERVCVWFSQSSVVLMRTVMWSNLRSCVCVIVWLNKLLLLH